MNTRIDHYWMNQAIELAKHGQYTTTPNPNVGCVIVDSHGRKVGQGAHLQAGQAHAEVHALAQAKNQAKGATAYVTLEPCCHTGKTPPCADALVDAQVARVVIANTDPNPRVSGGGIKRLQDAGIEVNSGVLADQAEQLNLGFFKRMRTGLPYVRLKMAASLDAKTALANGVSQWITTAQSRRDVQRYRASSCAIITGSGTVRADDPSLLVRPEQAKLSDYPDLALRQPLRVVVEGKQALNDDYQLFNDGQATLLATCLDVKRSFSKSVKVKTLAEKDGFPDLKQLLSYLGEQQCNNVWLEAGAKLAGAFIQAQLVDEFVVYFAAKLIGHNGLPLLHLPEYQTLQQVPQLQLIDCDTLGNDVRLRYTTRH